MLGLDCEQQLGEALHSLCSFAITEQKQPQTVHKCMSVGVFQLNVIYKSRQWARFDPGAIACGPLI